MLTTDDHAVFDEHRGSVACYFLPLILLREFHLSVQREVGEHAHHSRRRIHFQHAAGLPLCRRFYPAVRSLAEKFRRDDARINGKSQRSRRLETKQRETRISRRADCFRGRVLRWGYRCHRGKRASGGAWRGLPDLCRPFRIRPDGSGRSGLRPAC